MAVSTPPPLKIEISVRTLLVALGLVAAVYLAVKLWLVFVLVIVALVLAGTLRPMVRWLEHHRVPRGLALLVVFLGLLGALFLIGLVTLPPLVGELESIVDRAPALQASIAARLARNHVLAPLARSVQSARVQELLVYLGHHALQVSQQVVFLLGAAFTTLFLALYLIADADRAVSLLYEMVPRAYHTRLSRILGNLEIIVGGYVRGQVITSALMTGFVFVLLHFMGVPDALALAVFAGITDVLPFVGGLLATTPAVLAALSLGIGPAVGVLVSMIVYQEFESRILVPRVYGRALRLSPAAVIVALLAGGTLMGILGALLALPIAAAVRMVVRELRG